MSQSLIDLVGNTPLLHLKNFAFGHNVFAKLEYYNPLSSVKDRAALNMILDAEKKGLIQKGDKIVEATSGNTGIGLAWICAVRGYKMILTMPEDMSEERQKILRYLGARIVLTPAKDGMQGAIDKAKSMKAYYINQFSNPANPEAHFKHTAPEIYKQMNGKIDYAVFGVGTGGTITGCSRYLKKKLPNLKIIAVEPWDSPLLSKEKSGLHGIQGIGANFVPEILDISYINSITAVKTEDALGAARCLARLEGLFAGISSGAAAFASLKLAQIHPTARIVTVFPDTAERYLSTALFK